MGDKLASEQPKTVRFRIAVAIDDGGRGCAYGWNGTDQSDDKDKMRKVEREMYGLESNVVATHWIEVDIPVPVAPEPTTIEGTVMK